MNALNSLASTLPPRTGVCAINLDSRPDRWDHFQNTVLPFLNSLPTARISATLGTALPGYGEPPLSVEKNLPWQTNRRDFPIS